MSVIYSCVAYKDKILAHRGKSEKIQQQYMQSVPELFSNPQLQKDMRTCIQQPSLSFYIVSQSGILYIAVTEAIVDKTSAYQMLAEVAQTFTSRYSMNSIKFASQLQMDSEFSPEIGTQMNRIKEFKSKSSQLLSEVEEVKGLVIDNINQVMQRSKDLEDVATSAQALNDDAGYFRNNAKSIHQAMMKKKILIIAGIVVVVAAVLCAIIIPFCV